MLVKRCTCDLSRGGCLCGSMAQERAIRIFKRDYFEHHDRAKTAELNCLGHAEFCRWECCDNHRKLSEEIDGLRARARVLCEEAKSPVLSPAWWKEIGFPEVFDYFMKGFE